MAFLTSMLFHPWVNCNRIVFFRSSDLGQLASMISTFLESFPLSMQIRTVIHMFYRYVRVSRELILPGLSSNISSRHHYDWFVINLYEVCLPVFTHRENTYLASSKHKFSTFRLNVLPFTYTHGELQSVENN